MSKQQGSFSDLVREMGYKADHSLLTAQQEIDAARSGNIQLLISHNIRLAMNFAIKRRHIRLQFEDVFGLCILGLMQAAKGFNPDRGYRFSTMAMKCMSNIISRYAAKWRDQIQMPRDYQTKALSPQASAAVKRTKRALYNSVSVSVENEDGMSVADYMVAAPPQPEFGEDDFKNLAAKIARLREQDRFVLTSRFLEERTLEEVGQMIGVTRERVRQIEAQAIQRLQAMMGVDVPPPKPPKEPAKQKLRRGFACMSPEKRREIAAKGGQTSQATGHAHRFGSSEAAGEAAKIAHQRGTAHEFNSDEAAIAGQKGGIVTAARRKSASLAA